MRQALESWQAGSCEPGGSPEVWHAGETGRGDDRDWWFRTTMRAPTDGRLRFDGLATLSEVRVDGETVAAGESMWLPLHAPVTAGEHEVVVICRALGPALAERRRPRARWRQRVAEHGNLRYFRTTLLGRAPGFAPGPPITGLWRPAWLEYGERAPELVVRPRLDGRDGVVTARVRLSAPAVTASLRIGGAEAALAGSGSEWSGELRLPDVERWWPHSHGDPVLHRGELVLDGAAVARFTVGFRTLASPGDLERDGLTLHVNGVPVFARGAVWTPVPAGEERVTLQRARDAGLNCVRIPGTGAYESAAFHALCDELGMLVWQDLMFANLDYPFADPGFAALVRAEVAELVRTVGGRPSLAVLCGNSEIEQQVAMLGLDPALGRHAFFGVELPRLVEAAAIDAIYVPSAPCGAERPLRADRGVSNWFAVGGYRRPLADARLAGVRFASECLAIANVPDDDALPARTPGEAAWKAGVARDAGADWDFDDVRDFYLEELYGLSAAALLAADPERWLALSRAVSGEVMAEVFGEWRRPGSPCRGAIVLWLRDLVPGAGWGLLDHRGEPKAVLGALRGVLAPVAVWMTDEGMSGLAIHVANDSGRGVSATVRVAVYRDCEHRLAEASLDVELPAHGSWEGDVEALLGRWLDASNAYRFGPPEHDLVIASLHARSGAVVGQAARFPAGRPSSVAPPRALGLEAALRDGGVRVAAQRALIGVRVHAASFDCAEDGFLVEPGHDRTVALVSRQPGAVLRRATLTALNLDGPVELAAA